MSGIDTGVQFPVKGKKYHTGPMIHSETDETFKMNTRHVTPRESVEGITVEKKCFLL